jgi:hypothetical protein
VQENVAQLVVSRLWAIDNSDNRIVFIFLNIIIIIRNDEVGVKGC